MGHGKTYTAVANVILPALASGRKVITNIPLIHDLLFEDFPEYEDLLEFVPDADFSIECFRESKIIPGAYYVWDEVGTIFPSGIKQNRLDPDIQAYFTKHRHHVDKDGYSCEIALIVQDFQMLAMFLRSLVEEVFKTQKVTSFGKVSSKFYNVYVYNPINGKIGQNCLQRTLTGRYQSKHWRYYKSHTQSNSQFSGALEEKADDRGNLLKSKKFILFIAVFIVVLLTFLYHLLTFSFIPDSHSDSVSEVVDSQSKPIEREPEPRSRTLYSYSSSSSPKSMRMAIYELQDGYTTFPPDSIDWRITGQINGPRGDLLILGSPRGSMTVPRSRCGVFEDSQELFCVLRGELVTYYTGRIEHDDQEAGQMKFDLLGADSQ